MNEVIEETNESAVSHEVSEAQEVVDEVKEEVTSEKAVSLLSTKPLRETLHKELTDPSFIATYLKESLADSHEMLLIAVRDVITANEEEESSEVIDPNFDRSTFQQNLKDPSFIVKYLLDALFIGHKQVMTAVKNIVREGYENSSETLEKAQAFRHEIENFS